MQYILLIYNDDREFFSLPKEQLSAIYEAYGKFTEEVMAAGIMRGGSELAPTTSATTVRVRGGKVQVTDGPFAETKEQLGGYYIIDVANLDEATQWAAKIPSAGTGSIEVRPLVENGPN